MYVDVIKEPITKQGRKWRIVLKNFTGTIIMRGTRLYRYKKDTESMVSELKEALKDAEQ